MRDHISLTNQIRRDIGGNLAPTVAVLRWLDDHPDEVPGRTITDSEFGRAVDNLLISESVGEFNSGVRRLALELGLTITSDPEPTNAEKATADLETWGMLRSGALELGPWLAGQGWVKAPEEDSDE
ncbi:MULTISPECIES: hypothetical protein [Brevibacterium]|uniref:Uncharacterized protein n=1 Tax=Brevibacterium antiquum CNRZ 918 TaxID=1255637 RepID=A0A2H1KEB2_9MICO|nr:MULTISPECIES: hypothetical protein [Brevibacterium]SMX97979.1 hypothetical protein BANT918_02378 [Brevibacterium antiquum CNRZ 918]HCG55344.1 hypothetical protein [Brevibacterium sp.]